MKKTPPLWIACVPLVFLVALIACVVSVFGEETLAGASQIALLTATSVCVVLGLTTRSMTWADFERLIQERLGGISVSLFILLLIGALAGSWMVGGIVPTFICYGLDLISPRWFLVSSCLICALVSVMTGSSWTTIATIGIALMGIGHALDIHVGWTAGAIISGAYFGDKVSPLSDTTVLASSVVGTPLFTHIRYMMFTTVPTFTITLLIFTFEGAVQGDADMSQVAAVQEALASTFHLSPWLLLVPVITLVLIAIRVPSLAVLFISILMGAVTALLTQGHLLDEISMGEGATLFEQRFRATFMVIYGSTNLDTGSDSLNSLVSTRGMAGMLDTIWLILCATIFGAAMTASRMIDRIMQLVIHLVRGTV
ncbi:MAG: sodium:proton antiporter, partial [Bacteroidaceae bacterium]|nr:sodium:proton antiporter [Bacteroidaceae bacterium]